MASEPNVIFTNRITKNTVKKVARITNMCISIQEELKSRTKVGPKQGIAPVLELSTNLAEILKGMDLLGELDYMTNLNLNPASNVTQEQVTAKMDTLRNDIISFNNDYVKNTQNYMHMFEAMILKGERDDAKIISFCQHVQMQLVLLCVIENSFKQLNKWMAPINNGNKKLYIEIIPVSGPGCA